MKVVGLAVVIEGDSGDWYAVMYNGDEKEIRIRPLEDSERVTALVDLVERLVREIELTLERLVRENENEDEDEDENEGDEEREEK